MYFQLLQAIKTPFNGIKPITTGFQPARFMSQYQSFGQKNRWHPFHNDHHPITKN